MGDVLEYARERFLDRRQQVRSREREQRAPAGVAASDWRTLRPDEDDEL